MTRTLNSHRTRRATVVALLALAASAPALSAQLPNSSAAALGMGENYTAAARGFAAVAWNPAGLGVDGGPKVSFAILSTRALGGLDPVSLKDLKEHEGQTLSAQIRQQWLDEITAEGSEAGSGGADITFLAATVGRVGLQLSGSARAAANMGPGAAELLLFGNAGRTGSPSNISLAGSSFDAVITSTAALSYAQPFIRTADRSLAIGATLKYTFGHLMFTGQDAGGTVTADPLQVKFDFPMVVSDTVFVFDKLDNGSGIGLDLGATYVTGPWSFGAVARNVFNTFQWDESSLFYRPGEVLFNANESETDFTPQPFSSAPASLQSRVDDYVGQAEFGGGVAFQPSRRIMVTADYRQRAGEPRLGESKSHMGAGIELRPLSFLPIRAGGALLNDGGRYGTLGVGLEFGVLNLSASVAQRDTDLGMDHMAMFTLSSLRTR